MNIFSKITPAETLLITNSSYVKLKDLMKITFMDLLLKKVIEIIDVDKKPHPKDSIRTYTYIIMGKNFNKYKPKNHELIFLNTFQKSPSIQILFNHYIRMAYDLARGNSSYKKQIRDNYETKSFFKQGFFMNLFKINQLNDSGIIIKKEIINYLNEIDENIDVLLNNDKKKALELLLKIGGHIFLLKNLDFQLLKRIDKELLNQYKSSNSDDTTDNYDSYFDWWIYIDFYENDYDFDDYFDDFNNTIDTFESESSSWSSCDSDSGCSSCGGCGGCD